MRLVRQQDCVYAQWDFEVDTSFRHMTLKSIRTTAINTRKNKVGLMVTIRLQKSFTHLSQSIKASDTTVFGPRG